MQYLKHYLLLFMLVSAPWLIFGQDASIQDEKLINECNKCKTEPNKLEISYQGETEEGNLYNLYAFKYKKNWIFLLEDNTGYYTFTQRNERYFEFEKSDEFIPSDTLAQQSDFFTLEMCKIANNALVKKKDKFVTVHDLPLYSYYVLNRRGQKVYKDLNYFHFRYNQDEISKKDRKYEGKFGDDMDARPSSNFDHNGQPVALSGERPAKGQSVQVAIDSTEKTEVNKQITQSDSSASKVDQLAISEEKDSNLENQNETASDKSDNGGNDNSLKNAEQKIKKFDSNVRKTEKEVNDVERKVSKTSRDIEDYANKPKELEKTIKNTEKSIERVKKIFD